MGFGRKGVKPRFLISAHLRIESMCFKTLKKYSIEDLDVGKSAFIFRYRLGTTG